ncbi:MAG: caspase family protein, partial [Novipirellula sp. JB048]
MADKALLCGINDYKSIGDLRGCVNDTRSLYKLLIEKFNFKRNSIRVRKDSQVTKDELRKGWEWLRSGAQPGDRLVFHFSGHGSFTHDRDGDEDDGVDELLCLYGMDWDDPDTYLLDDELRQWTKQIPDGVLVTFVLDSCHSGTATRAVLPPSSDTVRGMSPQAASLVDVQTSNKRLQQLPRRTRAMAHATPAEHVEELVPAYSDKQGEANL